ncbi:ABC transporter permease [Halosolutus gelatinilyticus]|uniref:ABC transporter permease n=1 Tax=Halosolutus gelatinilyticus TaxID=2931975 RepID=UPI001FF1790D|nr:ABC transporter permease [Halosolutus gelatinilyticus]
MGGEDPAYGDDAGTRRSRWRGLVGVTIVRLWKRATKTRSGRVLATVSAVALTIALLLLVTGIALSLAGGGIATETDADVRVAPADSGTLSTVDEVEGPRLGAASERAETIRSEEGVDHASPVLYETVQLQSDGGEPKTVLLVGVVPDEQSRTVAGLPTDELESGDRRDATGSNAGPSDRKIVLSRAAAERLNASTGDDLAQSNDFTPSNADSDGDAAWNVSAIETAGKSESASGTPVAVVHLHDLQSASGADNGDLANHLLVWGDVESAEAAATEAYPSASVDPLDGHDPSALAGDGLALATSLLALVVGVVICASFVATTVGMTVDDDRRSIAVLEAVGIPTHGRLLVVALTTLATTLIGALLGIGLGIAGIAVLNAVAGVTAGPGSVAAFHPLFVPYAIVVALFSGLVAVPYPIAVAARTSVLQEVSR